VLDAVPGGERCELVELAEELPGRGGGEDRGFRVDPGLREAAVPIIIDGEHLATLFTGQFFYDDEKPDPEFFRAQAGEFGFDTDSYLAALSRVPLCSREQIRNIMNYYRRLVGIMTEAGLKNLRLTREVAERKQAENALEGSREYLAKNSTPLPTPSSLRTGTTGLSW